MEKRTLLIIAFACFSLGASIELLKNLGRNARVVKIDMDRAERQLGDYDVRLGTDQMAVDPIAKHAAISSGRVPSLPMNVKPIQGVPLAAATKKADGKKDKSKVAKADAKKETKKKKKRKKKKVVDPKHEELTAQQKAKLNGNAPLNNAAATYYAGQVIDPAAAAQQTPKEPEPDWQKILLANPSTKDIQKFIERHRAGAVNNNLYMQITKEMVSDPRMQTREHGLTLLNAAPSAISFVILAEALVQEPATSDYRSKLQREILNYSRLEYFAYLAGALDKNNSDAVHAVAFLTLAQAIETYRSQLTQAQNNTGPAPASTSTPAPATPGSSTAVPGQTNTTNPTSPNTTAANNSRVQTRQLIAGFARFQNPLKILTTEKDPVKAKQAAELLAIVNGIAAMVPQPQTPSPAQTQAAVPTK